MRPRRIIIVLVVALLVLGTLFMLLASRVPALNVAVVNEAGEAIAGANIKPDGIRGTDGAHYGWGDGFTVKPTLVITDERGRAKIPYPRFVVERVRSIELSFGVDHPEYTAERPFVAVASPIRSSTPFLLRLHFIWEDSRQSRKVERIVLKRGAILELEARVNGQTIAATNFQAQLVPKEGQFDGLFTRRGNQLISRKVPVGDFAVRACAQLNGTNYFSEGLHLSGVAGQTNIVNADLKPGLSVEGKLMGIDGAVRNGWVNARVINSTAGQLMSWADYGEVHPDGSFRLSGLPAGQLEVVAICDGYLSENGTNTILSIVKPHRFELPREERIEIPMRRSAVARIRVLGPKDERVAGASVNFWPNVQWGGYWTTIFATDFYREMEVLGKKLEGPGWGRDAKRTFFAETGEDGWAVVRELPPVALTFFVEHGDLELPLKDGGRESSIELNAGETNLTAVKLQVKSGEMRD